MNREIANAVSGYVETLYHINQSLIKLCGLDVTSEFDDGSKLVLDIIQDIPRLIPYSYNRKNNRLYYENRDGLLEYRNEIDYLVEMYNDILEDNYEFLYRIKKIRNKYEHKMHGAKHIASGNGSFSLFDFSFEVSDGLIEVSAAEFIKTIKSLNDLFSNIVEEIRVFANENSLTDYLYYKRITRFNFNDFNKLYDSDLIKIIGKTMSDF